MDRFMNSVQIRKFLTWKKQKDWSVTRKLLLLVHTFGDMNSVLRVGLDHSHGKSVQSRTPVPTTIAGMLNFLECHEKVSTFSQAKNIIKSHENS